MSMKVMLKTAPDELSEKCIEAYSNGGQGLEEAEKSFLASAFARQSHQTHRHHVNEESSNHLAQQYPSKRVIMIQIRAKLETIMKGILVQIRTSFIHFS